MTESIDPGVKMYETVAGGKVYQIPLNAFPGFWVYAYLVLVGDYRVLIDCGSNSPASNQNLEAGFQAAGEAEGTPIGFADLTHVFITHGHIDHFGGLAYVRPRTNAEVGVHELDRRNLTNYEERLVVVSRRLGEFLIASGVSDYQVGKILEMYMMMKGLYSSGEVDFTYEETGMALGPFEFLHTPGHCAGMVTVKLDDIVFTADHVLMDITPHQAPEELTLNTGLGHYIASLNRLKEWAPEVRFGLGGHRGVIEDLPGRIDEIIAEHDLRLRKILDLLASPVTVAQVSQSLFGKVEGYNVLLALEEAGAHVEYLYQRGFLGVDNLAELQENGVELVPVRYKRLFEVHQGEPLIPGFRI